MRYSLIIFGGKNAIRESITKNDRRPKFALSELKHRKGAVTILGIGDFQKTEEIEFVLSDVIKKSFPNGENNIYAKGHIRTTEASIIFVQDFQSFTKITDVISKFESLLKEKIQVQKVEILVPKWASQQNS
jgi:hypothetical protein